MTEIPVFHLSREVGFKTVQPLWGCGETPKPRQGDSTSRAAIEGGQIEQVCRIVRF
jgi:hypothetical protein